MALNSVFLSLCWRIPSSFSRSDANIQVLLSVFNALVFLLLTATGTVLSLLCAQLKRNHVAEGQKNSCIFLKVPGFQFLLEGAEGAIFSQSDFLNQRTPGSGSAKAGVQQGWLHGAVPFGPPHLQAGAEQGTPSGN